MKKFLDDLAFCICGITGAFCMLYVIYFLFTMILQ